MDDALKTLGTKIDSNQARDAVHVACMPIQLQHDSKPGTHVGINSEGKADTSVSQTIGILDPFIDEEYLNVGDWVWLMLYPRTITSLRHEWTHPVVDTVKIEDTLYDAQEASKQWILDYIVGGGFGE